jgi:hypothetical protein
MNTSGSVRFGIAEVKVSTLRNRRNWLRQSLDDLVLEEEQMRAGLAQLLEDIRTSEDMRVAKQYELRLIEEVLNAVEG